MFGYIFSFLKHIPSYLVNENSVYELTEDIDLVNRRCFDIEEKELSQDQSDEERNRILPSATLQDGDNYYFDHRRGDMNSTPASKTTHILELYKNVLCDNSLETLEQLDRMLSTMIVNLYILYKIISMRRISCGCTRYTIFVKSQLQLHQLAILFTTI